MENFGRLAVAAALLSPLTANADEWTRRDSRVQHAIEQSVEECASQVPVSEIIDDGDGTLSTRFVDRPRVYATDFSVWNDDCSCGREGECREIRFNLMEPTSFEMTSDHSARGYGSSYPVNFQNNELECFAGELIDRLRLNRRSFHRRHIKAVWGNRMDDDAVLGAHIGGVPVGNHFFRFQEEEK